MGTLAKTAGFLQVNSNRRVLSWTALLTLCAITASVALVLLVLSSFPSVEPGAKSAVLAFAAFIPSLLVPPLAFALLHTLRVFAHALNPAPRQERLDPLTQVCDKSYFLEKTAALLDNGGALVLACADHLEKISQTHGRRVADEALQKLALALRAANGASALIGRLSEEEFAVFIPGAGPADLQRAAARMNASICSLCHTAENVEIHLTASIGGAVHQDPMDLDALLTAARLRVLEAKHRGRNRAVLADAPPIAADFSDAEFWDEATIAAA